MVGNSSRCTTIFVAVEVKNKKVEAGDSLNQEN
jgi:hypothetical protein